MTGRCSSIYTWLKFKIFIYHSSPVANRLIAWTKLPSFHLSYNARCNIAYCSNQNVVFFHITIGLLFLIFIIFFFLFMQVERKKLWWITKQPCNSTLITQWLWWTWLGICVQREIFGKQSSLTRGLYWDARTLCARTTATILHFTPEFRRRRIDNYI